MNKELLFKRVEYALMAVFVVSLGISWHVADYVLVLLAVNGVVRMAVEKRVGNPALTRTGRWGLWLMLAYFACQAVSLLYSSNMEEGISVMVKMLPLAVFPALFLSTDSSHLTRNHVRGLLQAFALTWVVRLLVMVTMAMIRVVAHGMDWNMFFADFDPFHRAYLSMYVLLCFVFLYCELVSEGQCMGKMRKALTMVSAALMLLYIYFVQSRAGMLCSVVVLGCVLWHGLKSKNHRKGALALLALCVASVLAVGLSSRSIKDAHRMESTFEKVKAGEMGDVRVEVWSNTFEIVKRNVFWGVGIGDRMDEIEANYPDPETGTKLHTSHLLNPHNQYLDSWLSAGILSLLLLLAMMVCPFVGLLDKNRPPDYLCYLLPLMLVFAISCQFEAVLQRQYGLLFTGFFYGLFSMKVITNK